MALYNVNYYQGGPTQCKYVPSVRHFIIPLTHKPTNARKLAFICMPLGSAML